MSLSKPVEKLKTSPIKRYYTFNGATGTLSYYDKDTEEKVEVTEKFVFIPTDERNAVEGFDSKKEMGFRSNEVISTVKEELVVRWNNGQVLMKGFYNDIKDKVKAQGGKYTKSIYGITKINDEWEIINLKLKGASFSAWLELDGSKKGVIGLTIGITKGQEKKTGMVKYFEPKFVVKHTTEELHNIAVEKDSILQEYFSDRDTPLSKSNIDSMMASLTPEEQKQLVKPKAAKVVKTESVEASASDDDFFDDF